MVSGFHFDFSTELSIARTSYYADQRGSPRPRAPCRATEHRRRHLQYALDARDQERCHRHRPSYYSIYQEYSRSTMPMPLAGHARTHVASSIDTISDLDAWRSALPHAPCTTVGLPGTCDMELIVRKLCALRAPVHDQRKRQQLNDRVTQTPDEGQVSQHPYLSAATVSV